MATPDGTARKSTPSHESLSLARYAEVKAYLRRFPADKKDEVVARLGLRKRDWEAASAKWTAAMNTELESGTTELTSRFGNVFARAKKRLSTQRPSLESIGPLPGPDDAEPEQAPEPPRPPPLVVAPARPEAASVAPRVPPAPPMMPQPSSAPPAMDRPSPWAMYNRAGGSAPSVPPSAPPVEPQGKVDFGSTLPVASPPSSPLLPFRPQSTPPAQAAFPGFTMEQYASLRVEIDMLPDQLSQTLARYHVPSDAWPALELHWRDRLDADPALRAVFSRACRIYGEWLAARKAGPIRR